MPFNFAFYTEIYGRSANCCCAVSLEAQTRTRETEPQLPSHPPNNPAMEIQGRKAEELDSRAATTAASLNELNNPLTHLLWQTYL